VLAVRRPRLAHRGFSRDPQLVHQPSDPLGVDRVALPLKLFGRAAIAVGRPSARHVDQGVSHLPVLARPGFVVDAAARHAQDLAEQLDRIMLIQQQHHFSFLCPMEAGPLEAFSRISFSSVMRPRACSSSAIRACSSVRTLAVSKIVWARSRRAVFQVARRVGLRPCLRQASALGLGACQDVQDQLSLELGGELTAFLHSGAPPSGPAAYIMHLSRFRGALHSSLPHP
jgi:hypothetical protein